MLRLELVDELLELFFGVDRSGRSLRDRLHCGLGGENRKRGVRTLRLAVRGLDYPAAEDTVAVVEHDGLPGRNRGDWLVERELYLILIAPDQFGCDGGGAMPNLHREPHAKGRGVSLPVHLAR